MSNWKQPACTSACRTSPVSFIRVVLTALLSTTSTPEDRFEAFDNTFSLNVTANLSGATLGRTELFGYFDGAVGSATLSDSSVALNESSSACPTDEYAVTTSLEWTSAEDSLLTCVKQLEDAFAVTFVDIQGA